MLTFRRACPFYVWINKNLIVDCALNYFFLSMEIGSEIVFSYASLPYLSTSALFFSPCVRQPAPPIQPPEQAHALDEVLLKQTAGLFHQRRTAGFDSVAGYGVECEILMSGFFECFGNSIRKTAAAGKNPAEIGSIVKNILFKGSDVDILAVKQRLQLFKRQHAVNIGLDFLKLRFRFFRRAGPNDTTLQGESVSFRYFAIAAMGDGLCEINGIRSGKDFLI